MTSQWRHIDFLALIVFLTDFTTCVKISAHEIVIVAKIMSPEYIFWSKTKVKDIYDLIKQDLEPRDKYFTLASKIKKQHF